MGLYGDGAEVVPVKHQQPDDGPSDEDGSGTFIVHTLKPGSQSGSGIHNKGKNDEEGSGTMIIRDEEVLERIHSGEHSSEYDSSSMVAISSSQSESQARPWLNKYRTPDTWVWLCPSLLASYSSFTYALRAGGFASNRNATS